ncbi:dTMP kinase [Aurantiacibacter gangjinensis]|uniref:Thymidylate kinase n=1 Tax=Aurantiacibacter gangjinensis TaxID=502682 RepID=A0A0G9MQR8_9SPHN|nr:dTMP kinase [Aurantiacibacter gangjinensis]APE28777.1 Thymidylate kinase [Aurantiacibacter gangjinensis]KLE32929.1 thymidylate kinase [Aurantiacibacter gangjinensis]
MTRGKFITLEGGEGVGKSTQAAMLSDALRARGLDVLLTREPGGTPGAEAIRALLLDSDLEIGARTEALLFAAARADHVQHAIAPALERGAWVVCDRFVDSSRAYQGGGDDLFDDAIMALHNIGSWGMMPDVTFLLTAESEEVARRLTERDGENADRIGGRSAEYHAGVADRFRTLAASDPERFICISADGSPQDVHDRIARAMAPLTGEGG